LSSAAKMAFKIFSRVVVVVDDDDDSLDGGCCCCCGGGGALATRSCCCCWGTAVRGTPTRGCNFSTNDPSIWSMATLRVLSRSIKRLRSLLMGWPRGKVDAANGRLGLAGVSAGSTPILTVEERLPGWILRGLVANEIPGGVSRFIDITSCG
jgi:hypothetical protein